MANEEDSMRYQFIHVIMKLAHLRAYFSEGLLSILQL